MNSFSFSPTISISSNTLSAHSSQPPSMDSQAAVVDALFSTLNSDPHIFLQPPQSTAESVLALAKHYLDPLAFGITEEQLYRQKEARRKRKRGQKDVEQEKVLGLKKVHVDGFAVDQVWEQARRVLDAARNEVERGIVEVIDEAELDEESFDNIEDPTSRRVRFADDGLEEASEEDGFSDDNSNEEEEDDDEAVEELNGVSVDDSEEEGGEDIEMDEDFDEDDFEQDGPVEEFTEDKFGLNDGFFSIDDFNRQSEFLEQQDNRGEDDGAASDEEEVDWHSNPLDGGNAKLQEDDDDNDEESEKGDGPTFGDMDLDAPEGVSDQEEDMEEDDDLEAGGVFDLANTNNVMYSDFFAPPPQKAGKGRKKKGRPHPHNFPEGGASKPLASKDEEVDIERTMAAVHRELFSDSEDEGSEDALSDLDPSDPKSRRSTHERRQAKLAEEIRRLEAGNVAKRSWTLSGEGRAADRPLNSLLEEDLDFERAGKPIPVITQEISEDIEALIKRRIVAGEFDELVRRRPDNLATGNSRRGLFTVQDTKSSKGLAELYEEEHLRTNDPNYVSEKDTKTAAAHAEISALWKDVSSKLDSLSSWHYKPKPAMPSLEVRVDAPAITMEDARPTVGGEVGDGSMLAPQEVYKPGTKDDKTDGEAGEIVTKGGLPVKKDEMSREEKAARRRRDKERQKKANLNAPTRIVNGTTNGATVNGTAKKGKSNQDEKEMLGTLKKGGVKVIGKKGELTNVDGKTSKAQGRDGKVSAGAYKL